MGKKKYIKPLSNNLHPSQDRTNRFEVDALLRTHGFTIYSRKGDRVWWKKNDDVYLEIEALETLDQYKLADAQYIEYLYWEGFS